MGITPLFDGAARNACLAAHRAITIMSFLDLSALEIDHVAHGVYISGWRATKYDTYLRSAGLTHVLKLYDSSPFWPTDFTVCDNALTDGELIPLDVLQRGVSFIQEHVSEDKTVLVQCGAGISRSSTFVLAYLLDRGYELPDAWKLLKEQHPPANPHPKMWESLIIHYGLSYDLKEVVSW